MKSAAVRQTLWDAILCTFWAEVIGLTGLESGLDYTRNETSRVGLTLGGLKSDLSLLVYGKEVLFCEEDSGSGRHAAKQVKSKINRLDPHYFGPMQYMVCISTVKSSFQCFAYSGMGGDNSEGDNSQGN